MTPAAFQPNAGCSAAPPMKTAPAPASRHPARHPAITIGAGLSRPQGRLLNLAGWTPAAVADALGKLAGVEAWWTPHLFDGHYRQESRWRAAVALALDVDYHDANGAHVALPEGILARLAGAELPGTIGHATPRGYRLVAMLHEPITDADDYARAIAAFAAQARDALGVLGVLAIDGRNGLDVDAACHDRARLLFAPRATVGGVTRAADVVVLREQLYDVAEMPPAVPAEPSAPDETPAAPELPPVPLDCFPAGVGEYLAAMAENRCVDAAMPATFALGIASAAIGRAAEIELRPDWVEGGNLWLGHVAPPGKQKSPTLKAMAAPLFAYDDRLSDEHDAALSEWEANCEIASHKKAPLPERPRRKQAVVADTTIEALADVLEVSPRVAGLFDELGTFFDQMGAYKKSAGADRQNYLSLHAGARLIVNRKGKDPLVVARPCLGVVGATTPATCARVLGTMNGDGLVDRFFLTASRPVANRFKTPPVAPALRDRYLRIIAALCALPTAEPRVLTLTPEAASLFGDFYESCDASRAPVHFQGVVGKLAGHVAIVARTLTLWGDPHAATCAADVMRNAITLGKWLAAHTAHVRSAQVLSRRAAALVAWLAKREGQQANIRDVQRAGVAGVKTADDVVKLAAEAARAGSLVFDRAASELIYRGGQND